MASNTRIQLTFEEIAAILLALKEQQIPDRRLIKKLAKAQAGLEPTRDFELDYEDQFVSNNNPHPARSAKSITDIVMEKILLDQEVTEDEREQFHLINGYYP